MCVRIDGLMPVNIWRDKNDTRICYEILPTKILAAKFVCAYTGTNARRNVVRQNYEILPVKIHRGKNDTRICYEILPAMNIGSNLCVYGSLSDARKYLAR